MLHFFARRMKEARDKDGTGQGGFTLIELLVVVIIIGILAAIAIPTFLGQRERAKDAQAQSSVRNGITAAKSFYTQRSSYSPGGTNMTAADLSAQESALTYAATPSGVDPRQIGFSVNSANQVTMGTCAAADRCFWIRTIETGAGAGTTYGTSNAPGTVPATFAANWQ